MDILLNSQISMLISFEFFKWENYGPNAYGTETIYKSNTASNKLQGCTALRHSTPSPTGHPLSFLLLVHQLVAPTTLGNTSQEVVSITSSFYPQLSLLNLIIPLPDFLYLFLATLSFRYIFYYSDLTALMYSLMGNKSPILSPSWRLT